MPLSIASAMTWGCSLQARAAWPENQCPAIPAVVRAQMQTATAPGPSVAVISPARARTCRGQVASRKGRRK